MFKFPIVIGTCFGRCGPAIRKYLEGLVNEYAIFFQQFALTTFETQSTATVRTYALTCSPQLITIYHRRLYRAAKRWSLNLIVKCEAISEETNNSASINLVSNSPPRGLLVEVNSKPKVGPAENVVLIPQDEGYRGTIRAPDFKVVKDARHDVSGKSDRIIDGDGHLLVNRMKGHHRPANNRYTEK